MNQTLETEKNWEAEEWRQPAIDADDTMIFSECGRITHKTDFRSHWFKVVKQKYGPACLLVKHGGGEERFRLNYLAEHTLPLWDRFTSDERYMMLYMLYDSITDARRQAAMTTAHKYQLAFLEGRLKRRKRQNRYHVEMLPQVTQSTQVQP